LPRAAFYVDGFNVYHSIAELKKPYLKWLNHWRLAELVAEAGDEIVKVTFCTAYHPDFRKKVRHERYVKALENTAVTVLRGHYVHEDWDCRECGHEWKKPTEKQGDINVVVPGVNGSAAVIRPFEYAPPEGWVHPNDRPA
jgi:hypothetical protein